MTEPPLFSYALKNVWRDKVTLALHICRGNSRSRWYTEGGYDPIAKKLFSELDVDNFLLEYDTDRAGNLLSTDDQWHKLALVADTAPRVWG